ncbi:MAG: adenosine-specific kinase [Acidobacteria bacterium]|nr:adenosine-specific kinase [Acidobacteriota bacterium]
MEIKRVPLSIPADSNIIFGQAHFIKTAEDLYEAMVNSVPGARFGIAFCEASGPCLVRAEGNDLELKESAVENALAIGAGHSFIVVLRQAFPINVLRAIRECPEVCGIYCATANPVEVLVADLGGARAVLGVADGASPRGRETDPDVKKRKEFLRGIGYKL